MEIIRSFDSAEVRFGAAGPLMVTLYRDSSTLAGLDELERTQDALLKKFPLISTLTVIGQATSMFRNDAAVRARSV